MPAIDLNAAAEFIFVTQIHFCTMYGVCVWDWLTSLSNEHRYIWKSKWTPVKGLYLFTRYYVLAIVPFLLWAFCRNHSIEMCNRIYTLPVGLGTLNQFGAEAILIVRTYAFFNRDKRVLFALVAGLSGVLSYQIWVASSQMLPLPFLNGQFGPCLPMSKPGQAQVLGYFVAALAFDTSITLLTLGKAFVMRRNGSSSKIVQVFLAEGFYYYLLISAANLVNGIFYFQPRSEMSAIMIPLSVILSPILACRMILDIRARADQRAIYLSTLQGLGGARGIAPRPLGMGKVGPAATTDFSTTVPGAIESHGIELGSMAAHDDVDYKSGPNVEQPYHSVRFPYGQQQTVGGIRVDVEKGVIIR